jgi:hypothetical protein
MLAIWDLWFYEPRVPGRYLEIPRNISGYFGVEFNRNNAFTFDFTPSFSVYDQEGRSIMDLQ